MQHSHIEKNIATNLAANLVADSDSGSVTNLVTSLIDQSRLHCAQVLAIHNIDSIEFGHWLAIPNQQLLLVFRHQRCVAIDGYQLAA
ncbi:hypothetical protein [Psychrobacter sp.]|uniref:hypothetical protein n=1 Tax=Psychrobacter sp. TaxID=56811 RepID=UPI00264857EC|nr:hypothetical protein [Psychrobacter sp.]MDN6275226.1 hypothetical protein [Psychrobacter sp.]MDN6307442.1 hypothetical protein [Psychrobacter sp.]